MLKPNATNPKSIEWTITYTTAIKDAFFQSPPTMKDSNTQSLANNACLAFDWEYCDGTGSATQTLD